MLILGVDTSTEYLTVGIVKDGKVLAGYNKVGKLSHSDLLIPTIQKALKKSGKRIKDIGLFSVGIGPGSFTGLRIGVASIRGFAIALNKPIVGVPTLDAVAHNGWQYFVKKNKIVGGNRFPVFCPVLDAKKNQVYACIYGISGGKLVRKSDYLLEPVERLIKRLYPLTLLGTVRGDGKRGQVKGEVVFLGDGISIYREKLFAEKLFKSEFIDDKRWFPKASVIAGLGFEAFKNGKCDDPYDLEPLYLYARDCNVKKV